MMALRAPRRSTLERIFMMAVLACGTINLTAQNNTKKPAPAAAPAKPAPAVSKPAATTTRPATTTTTPRPGVPTLPGTRPGTTAPVAGTRPGTTVPAGTRPGTNVPGGTRPGVTNTAFGHNGPAARPGSPMSRPAPAGARDLHGAAGDVRMRPGSRTPMDVHDTRRNMDIHHNLDGGRRIESVRPDGRRFSYERGRPGYIEHGYNVHGRAFESRAYFYHGRAYNRYYSPYGYHGYALAVYAPGRYYPAAYYGWAYRPWGAPVRYGWGFAGRPWYGYYGAYYAPYPVYASPALWITDYALAATLSDAYAARQEADAGALQQQAYAGPPISPEAKQMVANEIQGDIALENSEATLNAQQTPPDPASSGIARLMGDGKPHAFVASREVDVVDGSGQECSITDGDILQLAGSPGAADTTANVTVLASKGGKDCQTGTRVAVGLDELQEMNNHLREQIDAGLEQLAARQGKDGLPAAPPSALAAPQEAIVAQGAPPPDPAGAAELAQQDQQATQSEKEVLASTSTPSGPVAPSSQPANNDDLFKPNE